MQAFFETIFTAAYLSIVLTWGLRMFRSSTHPWVWREFGIMAIVLGAGDAFHLLPRVVALWAGDMVAFAPSLGFGKLITSITMTAFYVLLYRFWRRRYFPNASGICARCVVAYGLAAIRIVLCLFPQNDWFSHNAPLAWGVIRNIPFALLGAFMIHLFHLTAAHDRDPAFRWMWLAIALSFGLYIPVVLFADAFPPIGMLMIPKTLAYVWMIWMGYRACGDESRRRLR